MIRGTELGGPAVRSDHHTSGPVDTQCVQVADQGGVFVDAQDLSTRQEETRPMRPSSRSETIEVRSDDESCEDSQARPETEWVWGV